jgi:protocatechuate 3,4-dioxygenase beta subunit
VTLAVAPGKEQAMSGSGIGRREFALEILRGLAAMAAAGGYGAAAAAERADRAARCTVYPQQTEGPYYLDRRLLRRDVTEGREGAPLTLRVQVVSATDCAPLRGLAVDVWHCDAAGVYSGYPGQLGGVVTSGETFLRGTQITDDQGRVEFRTIYPGWYPGRTTHVHFKVHVSRTAEATSQMYFPEDVTRAVYSAAPYRARGQKDTPNARDGVARFGGIPPLLSIGAASGGAYAAALTVAVAT